VPQISNTPAGPTSITPKDWLPDLGAFAVGLTLTWALHWRVRDLVWSLWLSSLVIGYATIVISIGRGAAVLSGVGSDRSGPVPLWFKGASLFGALFLVAFFTVHFGGFHFVHSVFLNLFFPVAGDGTFAGFGPHGRLAQNPFPTSQLYLTVLDRYWPFLFASVVAERRNLLHPARGLDFKAPYANVIRMHLLIFFFAFAAFLHVDSFLVYTVVFAVYFFPFSIFRREQLKRPTAGVTALEETLDA
jgi:uncharacterized protein DUF6498